MKGVLCLYFMVTPTLGGGTSKYIAVCDEACHFATKQGCCNIVRPS